MSSEYLQEFVNKLNNQEDFRKEIYDLAKNGLLPEKVHSICNIILNNFMQPIPETDSRGEEEILLQERLALIKNELFANQQAWTSLCKIVVDSCESPKEWIDSGSNGYQFIESQAYSFFIYINKDSLLKDKLQATLRNWLYENQRRVTDLSIVDAVANEAAKLGFNFTAKQAISNELHANNCKNLLYNRPLITLWYKPILQSGSNCWNKWRDDNPSVPLTFSGRVGPSYIDNGTLDLSNVNMRSLLLLDCSFNNIDFRNADFSNSRLIGCEFLNCNLSSVSGLDRDMCTIDSSCKT